SDGVVDWWCAPRFDSPSLFAALLDHDRGGHFALTVEGPDVTTRQLYLADTAVLVTRFLTPDGVGEVVDFMPVEQPETATDRHRLIRVLRVTRGRRSEEHTSELQSRENLVCRLLLEKKKKLLRTVHYMASMSNEKPL